MKPVVVGIRDGLGNQLFQFASGYALAKRLGVPLILDVSSYTSTRSGAARRLKLLELVNPGSYFATVSEYTVIQKLRDQLLGFVAEHNRHSYRYGLKVVRSQAGDDRPVSKLSNSSYLAGYQFDYRDFVEFLGFLRTMIVGNLEKVVSTSEYGTDYAFLHVRRGDYVTNTTTERRFRVLENDYFSKAMNRFETAFGKQNWVVCSDDIEAAMSLMPGGYSVHPSRETSELADFSLVVNARGGVTSNSTFSFWGALLGENHKKSIVTPSHWRIDGRPEIAHPDQWIQI